MSVGLLVLAGLGFMGLAATTTAQAPPKKGDLKSAAQPRVNWNEKKIVFEMRGKKWGDVFEWFADQSGMPYSSTYPPPGGTYTFINPKDDKGKSREYTLTEIWDIINETLQVKEKHTLLRLHSTLTMIPADVDPPSIVIPLISLKELPERGKTDIVRVIVQLKGNLIAEEFAVEAKRMLGDFGVVTPLPASNRLILQSSVANLRVALDIINGTTPDEGPESAHSLTHKCKYVRASTAETLLKSSLGATKQIVELQKKGGGGSGSDTKDGGGQGGGNTQRTRTVRETTISSEKTTNTVYVNGSADKVDLARKIVVDLDKPAHPGDQGLLTGKPLFQYHDLSGGSAETMAKILSEIFKTDDSVRISVSGPSRLFVYGDPQTHLEINNIVKDSTPPSLKAEVISLKRLEASKLADTLKNMFPDSKNGSPFIEADTEQNAIRLRGTDGQIKEVTTVIGVLDGTPLGGGDNGDGGDASKSRMIILEKGSGATVAEAMAVLFKKLRPDIDVKTILPGQLEEKLEQLKDKQKPSEPVPAPKVEKKKSVMRLTPDTLREAMYLSNTRETPVLFDPQEEKKQEKKPAKKKSTVTIAGYGNRIIITSDDPVALDLAQQIIRILVNTEAGPGDIDVLTLKVANAVDVAKVLDEAFNGPKDQGGNRGQGGRGLQIPGIPSFMTGAFGAAPGGRTEVVRVVADPMTNKLLIRAKPIDMLTIRRLIDKHLDVHNADTLATIKTFIIGPLKNASAATVAEIIERVYRDSINSASSSTTVSSSPGSFFSQRQSSVEPAANRHALLSVAVDNPTNSIVVACPTTLYTDIDKLVSDLDKAAGDNRAVVKIISAKDIDPYIVQQAIDAISGKTTAMQQQGRFGQPGSSLTPGSFSPGGFGTPNRFQGGSLQGGGGFPGVVMPTGGGGGFPAFTPGGGGGGGTGRQPGGGGGGTRTPKGGASLDRGRDFFVSPVMDDRSVNVLYDPFEEQQQPPVARPASAYMKRPVYSANPLDLVSLMDQPEAGKQKEKEKDLPQFKDKGDVNAPRLPVQIEVLDTLGVFILRAQNAADLAAAMQIIELIRRTSQPAQIEIKLIPVRFGDPTAITNTLNGLFGRVILGTSTTTLVPGGARPGGAQGQPTFPGATPGGGFQQQQPQAAQGGQVVQPTNIVMIPQPRLGAILVAASKAAMPNIEKEIHRLDQPYSDVAHAVPIPLARASAARVAASLTAFYATRFPAPEGGFNQIRFTSDDGTNSVIVQAAPADMDEIRRLIEYIDKTIPLVSNELRVVQLRNAVAQDLAALLNLSIANGVLAVNPNQPAGGAAGGGGFGGGAPGSQPYATRDGRIRFVPGTGIGKDGKPVDAHILEDIKVNYDLRTNALVISAPEKTMPLVLALVRDLDVQPNARSEINIFRLYKSDAIQVATMLQQLFLGSGGVGTKTTAGGGGAPAAPAAPGGAGAAATARPLTLTIGTTTPEGAPIIDLRLTVDERTNSLIVAGSRNDLLVVESIIARIEDTNIMERRQEAVRLRNQSAVDVANAVSTFLTQSQALFVKYNQGTNFLELQREVVVVAEPISNSLLVSATPKYFDDILHLIAKLDTTPPQVVIQVLIAEVTMNGSEEFGMEIGLQNPLSFQRGLIQGGTPPGTTPITYTAIAGAGPGSPGTTTSTQPFGNPGFFFNNPNIPIPNNTGISPSAFGVQSLSNLGVGRVSSASGLGGFVFSANSNVVSVLIRALKMQGRFTVLSRPQLMTLDNQTAVIQVVTNFPLISGASVVLASGAVTPPPIVHQPLGITMQVTPRITPDGRIIMRVIPEVSAIDRTDFPLGNGTFGTSYKTQHLETTVSATDGETVLLGGLISKRDDKNENKIPWLGDLPGIGAAFRYRTYTKTKTELVIIMTPHIVRNRDERERVLVDETRRIDWSLADVLRIHGNENCGPFTPPPTCSTLPEMQSKTQPFRIFPRAGKAAERPVPAAAPVEFFPDAPRVQPTPQTSREPIGSGSLLPSIGSKQTPPSAADPVPSFTPLPLPEVISAGSPTPPAPLPNSLVITMPQKK
jgi:general secretion pathway protein D